MDTRQINIGDVLLVDQEYIDWHGCYHNLQSGLRLHKGQQTRPPVLGEYLHVNHFWLAEAYMIELCSADGFIFRTSQRDALRMGKAYLESLGAVFYGDAMMKPLPTCDYCEERYRMKDSKYCAQCAADIVGY